MGFALVDVNALVAHIVDQAVLLRDAPRPQARQVVPERFGPASTFEWLVAQAFVQQQEQALKRWPAGLLPVQKIPPRFKVPMQVSTNLALHASSGL